MKKKNTKKVEKQEVRDKSQDDNTSSNSIDLEQQLEEAKNQLARARADYTNLEKRIKQQQSQFVTLTTAAILSKFVAILDNLKMAAAHIDDAGLNMIVDQTEKMILEEGVTVIEAEDKEFNPETMECVERVEGPENMVVKVIQTGYTLNSHVLRPAKVHVGAGESN